MFDRAEYSDRSTGSPEVHHRGATRRERGGRLPAQVAFRAIRYSTAPRFAQRLGDLARRLPLTDERFEPDVLGRSHGRPSDGPLPDRPWRGGYPDRSCTGVVRRSTYRGTWLQRGLEVPARPRRDDLSDSRSTATPTRRLPGSPPAAHRRLRGRSVALPRRRPRYVSEPADDRTFRGRRAPRPHPDTHPARCQCDHDASRTEQSSNTYTPTMSLLRDPEHLFNPRTRFNFDRTSADSDERSNPPVRARRWDVLVTPARPRPGTARGPLHPHAGRQNVVLFSAIGPHALDSRRMPCG